MSHITESFLLKAPPLAAGIFTLNLDPKIPGLIIKIIYLLVFMLVHVPSFSVGCRCVPAAIPLLSPKLPDFARMRL